MKSLAMKKLMLYGGGAIFFIVIAVLVLLLVKKRLRQNEAEAGPSGYMMAVAMESVLRGQPSLEALGKLVFDALRFGNFRTYRSAFAMAKEIDDVFPPANATAIKQLLNNEQQMRRSFDSMREGVQWKQVELESTLTNPENAAVGNQQQNRIVRNARLRLRGAGGTQELALGSLLRGPMGWKLLLPGDAATD